MTDYEEIATLIRNLIQDNEQEYTDVFVYTGTSDLFTLTEKNVNEITELTVNEIESGVTYFEDLKTCRFRITSPLLVNDVIEVRYKGYSNYSNTELYAYITSAISHLSVVNFKTFVEEDNDIVPEPDTKEKYLIAVVASILIDPKNISYRMPDVSVTMPKDLNTFDKISKVLSVYKRSGNIGEMFVAQE